MAYIYTVYSSSCMKGENKERKERERKGESEEGKESWRDGGKEEIK